jgi:excisionase family DNA binding protein
VNNGFNFDGFIDALAERVAQKLRGHLDQDGGVSAVRPRLLTVEQAAVYLGRTEEGARHLIASGRLATVKMDRRVFIDVKDLHRLIEKSKT